MIAALAAAVSLLTACTSDDRTPPSPQPTSTSTSSSVSSEYGTSSARAEIWREDVAALLSTVAEMHPDLVGNVPSDLRSEAERLSDRATDLDDDELMVGVMRLATGIATSGRDGHTGLFVWGEGNRPVHSLPLRVWSFSDGLYVEDQLGGRDLVGERIVGIGGHPLAEVFRAVDPLVPRDNAATIAALRPRFLLIPEVLHGLGLLPSAGSVPLQLVGADGQRHTVTVPPVSMDTYNEWAGPYGLTMVSRPGALRRADQVLWHRVLATRTLYVSYDSVQPLDDSELDEVARLARSRSIDRVVVDVRENLGGEVGEDTPLLDVLSDPRVARPGRLFLLTGRNTFSAAVLFAAALRQRTPVTIVGEPPGGAPASYGNSEPVRMEQTGLVLSVATTRETATPGERRHVLVPDVAVPVSSADYFAGRDPVLETALRQ
jgi:hypothetical protein